MSTWGFALIVLLFGVGLTYLVEQMKFRSKSRSDASQKRSERAKWIYYWYLGRFPTKEEAASDDEEAERKEEAEREKALKRKDEEQRRK